MELSIGCEKKQGLYRSEGEEAGDGLGNRREIGKLGVRGLKDD